MALLYSGLDATAAGEVVAALEAEGVPFEVSDGAILVDARRARPPPHGARRQGPAGRRPGRLRDPRRPDRLRHHQPDVRRRLLARQGGRARPHHHRLARTSAPPASTSPTRSASRSRARPAGSASVTVTMARGELDRGQAEAIRYLVSSAVAGIAPEAVAVMDAATRRRARRRGGPARRRRPSATDRAATLRANIERLLEARVGPGRAIVEVNVDAGDGQRDGQRAHHRPRQPRRDLLRGRGEQRERASGTNPGVTVASNLPDGDVSGDAAATIAQRQREPRAAELRGLRDPPRAGDRSPARSAASASRSWSTASPPPTPRASRPGRRAPSPRSRLLRQLVQSAIGFDAERGDVVTIESLQFTLPPEQGALVERAATASSPPTAPG